jgi:DNA gyrase/topoisomerase IV subunit B
MKGIQNHFQAIIPLKGKEIVTDEEQMNVEITEAVQIFMIF